MEMGRLLWTWNAAVEATRFGARLAVVCDIDDTIIKARMIGRLPALTDTEHHDHLPQPAQRRRTLAPRPPARRCASR